MKKLVGSYQLVIVFMVCLMFTGCAGLEVSLDFINPGQKSKEQVASTSETEVDSSEKEKTEDTLTSTKVKKSISKTAKKSGSKSTEKQTKSSDNKPNIYFNMTLGRPNSEQPRETMIREEESKSEPSTPRKEILKFAMKPSGKVKSSGAVLSQPEIKAGSHDDNEEFAYYQQFLDKYNLQVDADCKVLNLKERYIIRVLAKDGSAVPFATVKLVDKRNNYLWCSRTYPNGETLLFTSVDLKNKYVDLNSAAFEVSYLGETYKIPFRESQDRIIELTLPINRTLPNTVPVDIVFLLDATGSMSDEINSLKDVIFSIHSRVSRLEGKPELRFGLVSYRDRGDAYITRVSSLTADVDYFQEILNNVIATGGGDEPEDLQAGLKETLTNMPWKPDAVKIVFLMADAPPHTDYEDEKETDYVWAMKKANEDGVKICVIGASGLGIIGEYIFRQLAVYTYGKYIFLTYGEKGESDGDGSPGKVSHHTGSNYSVKKLDDLVVDIVRRDVSYLLPLEQVTSSVPVVKPVDEQDYLEIRIDNIIQQIHSQMKEYLQDNFTAAIIPFEYSRDELKELADYLGDMSSDIIVRNKWLKLLERTKLNEILKEQKLELTGISDSVKMSQIGKLLQAQTLLLGKLYYLGTDRVLYLRAIDVPSSQIVAAARVRM